MLKRLVELKYLKRVSKGVYRLNPFIYLPYKANGVELQKEWLELESNEETEKEDECKEKLNLEHGI